MRPALLAVLLLLPLLVPVPAGACSCRQADDEWAIAYYDYIFEGTVVSVTRRPDLYNDVVVEVTRGFKGPCELSTRVDVVTWWSTAGCGYDFQVGRSYVIFAAPSDLGISTHLCSNTQPSPPGSGLLALLEEIESPVPLPEVDPEVSFQDADGVFSGRVVTVTPAWEGTDRVVIDVADSWKGVGTNLVTLYVEHFPVASGFQLAQEYLVFADFHDGYWTAACGNAPRLADAGAVLAWLGEPTVTPTEPVTWGSLKARHGGRP